MDSTTEPDYVFREARLDTFPKSDAQSFSFYTDELTSSGFALVGDYLAVSPKLEAEMFVRLFAHPVYNCFMEVYQIFLDQHPTQEVRYMASSVLEQGWSLGTSGHALSPIVSRLASRPRAAWTSHEGATTFQVLHYHLKTRQRLTTRRRLAVVADVSFEAYLSQQQEGFREQRAWLEGKSDEAIRRELVGHPRTSWMGE